MWTFSDSEAAEFLVRDAPQLTVNHSPLFDFIINTFRTAEAPSGAAKPMVTQLLVKLKELPPTSMSSLATQTPVDQTITCVFAHILGKTWTEEHMINSWINQTTQEWDSRPVVDEAKSAQHQDMERRLMEHFELAISRVHCLDYLDFIRRVLHALYGQLEKFIDDSIGELCERFGYADLGTMGWLVDETLSPIAEGWMFSVKEEAAETAIRRIDQMQVALGEHYSKEVVALISQRPHHVVGSYFVAKENAIA